MEQQQSHLDYESLETQHKRCAVDVLPGCFLVGAMNVLHKVNVVVLTLLTC